MLQVRGLFEIYFRICNYLRHPLAMNEHIEADHLFLEN